LDRANAADLEGLEKGQPCATAPAIERCAGLTFIRGARVTFILNAAVRY
jgi:hypothetical protein